MPIPKHGNRSSNPTRPPRKISKRKPRRVQSKYPPRAPPVNEKTNRRKRPIRTPTKKVKHKPRVVIDKKTQIKKKVYIKTKWITITFLKDPIHTFFPSNIFPEAIGSQRMSYAEANARSNDFWHDKKIVFHMADRSRNEWLPFYKRVIDNAKIAWIKFAAKTFMTYMTELDTRRYNVPLSFYRIIDESCDNILWELPLNYGGFFRDKNRVQLTLYDKKYEVPLKRKKIDFLAVIDKYYGCNRIRTLELMRRLSQAGYRVKVILINDKKHSLRKYNKKRLGIETILNNKNSAGQELFHKLCQDSKIVVDLSFRWTYGRVVYEALLNGALSICTNTYGASHHLFPDLLVDASNPNMQEVYNKCINTISKWSPELVGEYRKQAQQKASPQSFARNLNKITNQILGE